MARKRNRPYNVEDVKFVYENYAEMTAQEIAEERGLSKFQVAKIVSELRKKGIPIPKKTAKRKNPVDAFIEQLKGKKGKK
ncbi:hypothetical protein DBT_2247 [Dissulfuribacter thermophilus]|uniref:Uncharacterized protein n=1 Tax=Dissulfuribacter thermophilus TaxID=1156395 RepID=A0A1B9F3G2_9BACT|nr:helix-turn-helix domain-containing protein [Dissulfuribacter thermophilus]OCC14374.1 hypothetical protein DBT_2247 [Dissulfuribacter thermophilus]